MWVDAAADATQFDVVSPQQLPKGWTVVARGVTADPASEETDDAEPATGDTGDERPAVVCVRRGARVAHGAQPP